MARILLVEDDLRTAATLRKALERAGHSVATAGHGGEALLEIKRSKIELVIADICMPVVDGIELITEIRRAGQTIKVMAISGEVDCWKPGGYLRAARAVGADQALKKPFSMVVFIEAVDALLAGTPRASDEGRV